MEGNENENETGYEKENQDICSTIASNDDNRQENVICKYDE